jgi:hypothetical protein
LANKIQSFFNKKIDGFLKKNKLDYSEIKTRAASLAVSRSSVFSYYDNYINSNNNVVSKMNDFLLMMEDPIISNALEIHVDDACQYSPITRKRVWPSLKKKNQNKMVQDLFDDQNIDEDSWEHLNRLGMFGNCILRLRYKNPDFSGGVENIEIEEDIFRYIPIELNGILVKYIDKYTDELLEPFEVVFGKINILARCTIMNNFYNLNIQQKQNQKFVIKNTFKYGTGLFENSRRIWKQIKLLEDNLILARLDRTPTIRIFKVKTFGMQQDAAVDMIDFYSDLLAKTNRRLTLDDDALKNMTGQIGYGENIMLPVEDKGDIEVQEFGGDTEVKGIVDVDLFTKKFYASLKTPLEWLGLDSDKSFTIGDGGLLRKEIQYARQVKKLQFSALKMYSEVAFYHLLSLGEEIDYNEVTILMNIVSTAEDEEFKSALKNSIENVNGFVELINNIKEFLLNNQVEQGTQDYLLDYLTTRILNNNDFNWKEFFKDMMINQKPEQIDKQNSDNDIVDNSDEEVKDQTESRRLIIEEIRQKNIPLNLALHLETVNTLSIIPKFGADKNIKYIKDSLQKSDKRYKVIFEDANNKIKKLRVEDFKDITERTTDFDIGVFNLNYDPRNINFSLYDVVKTEDRKINQDELLFTQNVFNIKQIMNTNIDNKITFFELNNKVYCDYLNGCKYFKNVLEDKINNYHVISLKLKPQK